VGGLWWLLVLDPCLALGWEVKLSDKIGFYKITSSVYFTSGLLFMVQYIRTFWDCVQDVCVIMTVADMFRPAIPSHLPPMQNPKIKIRALISTPCGKPLTAGPALGGLITNMGYSGLFWVDGSSCIISILILHCSLKERKTI
jgi:hypothetical protein